MNHLDKLRRQIRNYLFILFFIGNAVSVGVYWCVSQYTELAPAIILGISLSTGLLLAALIAHLSSSFIVQPTRALWQAVLHLNPEQQGVAAPVIENLRLGRELITSLTTQIYQLVNVSGQVKVENQRQAGDLSRNFIAQNLPLPLIMLDASETIVFANPAAAAYIGAKPEDLIGKNVYMVLDISFPSEDTFDSWLKSVKTKNATAASSWERVRLNVSDSHPVRLFDLAAYYNRDNPDKHETMLVLFDHTKQYSQDDQSVSFMALSVHELRTPLTLLRGYIEVFEEEFGKDITDPELRGFMLKMHAMAEQLTAFVNNILNVARVDEDQLELRLQPEDWATTLKNSIETLNLRAKVRGITLECRIGEGLPPVGIDKLSILEVVNNLVDNAIKYSNTSKNIVVSTYLNKEGLVETSVQDFGLGIPSGVMPNLFTKFYRDHRNRAQIGGTGLGLYLSKAIVTAHGGTLWVRSKEGEGSVFGFSLLPYAQITENLKKSGDQEIVRGAHGWIKNHSLYRR